MRVIATAGHVDHGKSSLVERLTGTNPDRFEEERRRGLTIDLGFAHTTLPSGEGVSFIDVPGHVRFLRNMLAGVGGIDACLFVVAASEGWKPQSEEHLRILSLLGTRAGVIALTKVDLVDGEWCDLQEMDVRDRVAATFLADAPIVRVSAVTGAGLDELRAALDDLVHRTAVATDVGRPRLWVDRAFAAKGSGTVVTGTLTGGSLHTGQRMSVAGHEVRIRGIQSHGQAHDSIGPGNRVALNLAGVDHHQVHRGDAVVALDQWRPTARFDASLHVLPSVRHDVSRRGAYMAYIGSRETPVRVRVLGPDTIAPGAEGLVRLHLRESLPLVRGDRYILRESGRDETVGGGEVLDVQPVLPASKAHPDGSVERVIAERGWIDVADLEALTGERRAATIGSWVFSPSWLQRERVDLEHRIVSAGLAGLDLAELDDQRRAVVGMLDGVMVEGGRARVAAAEDPLAQHPFIAALRAGGVTPPDPEGMDRGELRELVRRKLVIERDGIYFHSEAIDHTIAAVAALLRDQPEGFTVADLRDRLGVTRKYALPLLAELDGRAITRRRGDLRVQGPRWDDGGGSGLA